MIVSWALTGGPTISFPDETVLPIADPCYTLKRLTGWGSEDTLIDFLKAPFLGQTYPVNNHRGDRKMSLAGAIYGSTEAVMFTAWHNLEAAFTTTIDPTTKVVSYGILTVTEGGGSHYMPAMVDGPLRIRRRAWAVAEWSVGLLNAYSPLKV